MIQNSSCFDFAKSSEIILPGNYSVQIRHYKFKIDAAKKGATLRRTPESRLTPASVPNCNSGAQKASPIRPKSENA